MAVNLQTEAFEFEIPYASTVRPSSWLPAPAFRDSVPSLLQHKVGVVFHYPGATGQYGHADNVVAALRSVQAYYRASRGYDIGYNAMIDQSGRIGIARGLYRSAANGSATDNNSFFAINLLIDYDSPPTLAQIVASQRLVHVLRTRYGYGQVVKGHQELKATACPSAPVMELIRAGAFEPRPSSWPENVFNPEQDVYGLLPSTVKPPLHGGEGPGSYVVEYLQGVLHHRASQHQLVMPFSGLFDWTLVGAVINLRAIANIPQRPGDPIVDQRVWDVVDMLATQ